MLLLWFFHVYLRNSWISLGSYLGYLNTCSYKVLLISTKPLIQDLGTMHTELNLGVHFLWVFSFLDFDIFCHLGCASTWIWHFVRPEIIFWKQIPKWVIFKASVLCFPVAMRANDVKNPSLSVLHYSHNEQAWLCLVFIVSFTGSVTPSPADRCTYCCILPCRLTLFNCL